MLQKIKLEFTAGTNIDDAVREAFDISLRVNGPVEFRFNTVDLVVNSNMKPLDVVDFYMKSASISMQSHPVKLDVTKIPIPAFRLIGDAVYDAKELSRKLINDVEFEFNGVTLRVNGWSNEREIIDEYFSKAPQSKTYKGT